MIKDKKPGWEYIYSETLEQRVAYHLATGWLFCFDGTKYSPHELSLLRNVKLPKCVHDVKRYFNGTIVKVEKNEKEQKNEIKTQPTKTPRANTPSDTDENGQPYIF
ncbi:hypothetical protein [Treponema lecithinolyticum]